MTAVFSSASRLPVLRKNKTVFHITAVLHITVVFDINCVVSFVWFLFEIRHAKQCWFHHAKTKIRLHIAHPPFKLNWQRPETCKKKQFHLPRKFLQEIHAHAGHKNVSVWLFHAPCKQAHSGIFPTRTYCGQNGLGKFFVVRTCLGPVHIIHPSMLVTLAPTKSLSEQIAKTG